MAKRKDNTRINEQIKEKEVRLIDEEGENQGVMPLEKALEQANPKEGLDLVEITRSAKPPVVRLMNYDKYRYELEKKKKQEKRAQKAGEMKQVQISARSAQHDLETGLKKLEKFLEKGHPVEIQMKLFGREKGNKDWARRKLESFMDMIETDYRVIQEPRFGGWGMLTQITKK